MADWMIYGANGYTGDLIAREAARRGMTPVVAGRNADAVTELAAELGLPSRVFALDRPDEVRRHLSDVGVVLNCAGPFSRTATPMATACLETGTHYLDVTGEIGVFEALASMDAAAKAAGVMLLPGVGFDVVPTDCLAVHLKQRLPGATKLRLGFKGLARMSRGTATTVAENFHRGGAVRRNGRLVAVPAAWKTRMIHFDGEGDVAMTIPWGDVSTAYHSTGIRDIEVYVAAPLPLRIGAYASRLVRPLLGLGVVQRYLRRRILAAPPGPTAEQRQRGWCLVWGEVTDEYGRKATSRLRGPEGYTATVRTALACVERVRAGEARPGYATPGGLFGGDFVTGVEGFERVDD